MAPRRNCAKATNWTGIWSLNANNGLYPRLIVDYTITANTTPPTVTINPLSQWSPASFMVAWSGMDNPGGSSIDHYDVQYSINGSDKAGNIQAWTSSQAQTTVDSVPPTASVAPLPEYSPQVTVISWSGSDDAGSGIATYDVEYRAAGGVWQALLPNTTATSFVFTVAHNDVIYEFRARGVDNVGNVQPPRHKRQWCSSPRLMCYPSHPRS